MYGAVLNFWSLLVRIFAPFLVRVRLKKKLEHRTRYKERYGFASLERPPGELFWFHGASVGESLSILPLIEKIAQTKPNASFLITTTTKAAAKVLETRINEKISHQFLPFDAITWVDRFLDHWKPNVAFFVESEIWPNLLRSLKKRQIKTYLLNARISENSFRNWRLFKGISRNVWHHLSGIYTQSDEFTQRFHLLGANHAKTLGNIKLLSPPLPFNAEELEHWSNQINGRKCWIAASTHAGEEIQILEVHNKLKKSFPDLLTIIAPRHMQRNDYILKNSGDVKIAKFSDGSLENQEVLLIDAMAKLGIFYRICPVAFIGGSLIPRGGHNPLEPLSVNSFPIWGPHFFNFNDMMPLFEGVLCQQKNLNELAATLHDRLEKPEETKKQTNLLKQNIDNRKQEINKGMAEILEQTRAINQ